LNNHVKLDIVAGPMQGKEFLFTEHDTFLFGRAPECQANLPNDSFVSRYHFLLEINPPHIRLTDMNSLNGTYVNGVLFGGRKVQGKAQQTDLKDGDRIQVGETVFLVKAALASPRGETNAPHSPTVDMAVSDMPTLKGESLPLDIPGYTLVRELGQGAMGQVYLATSISDGSHAAIKVMRACGAVSGVSQRIFEREIGILRSLTHRNIVRFIDSGAADGRLYCVMEYCSRGSVQDLLTRNQGRLPLNVAVALLQQALKGLACAHAWNFVHRDIKPPNLLVHGTRTHWVVKIADFGLAKSCDKAGLSGMTATGNYGGTLHFMPREQLINYKYVRPVSDVWSLAATFYHMVTGALPRDTGNTDDPIGEILNGEIIPLRKRDSGIPEPLARVIDHALAIDPADRYPDASAFQEAFNQVL